MAEPVISHDQAIAAASAEYNNDVMPRVAHSIEILFDQTSSLYGQLRRLFHVQPSILASGWKVVTVQPRNEKGSALRITHETEGVVDEDMVLERFSSDRQSSTTLWIDNNKEYRRSGVALNDYGAGNWGDISKYQGGDLRDVRDSLALLKRLDNKAFNN